jgi:SAM-dependent methyltransferase
VKASPYESQRYLHEYLLFHYGQAKDLCPFGFVSQDLLRFHERIREECLLPNSQPGHTRALDIGCAVGRFTFELSRVANEVIGIDNSKRFILAARNIARRGAVEVQIHESGAEFSACRVRLPKRVRPGKVRFQTADAQKLGSFARQSFDIVAAVNLICRLPSPSIFLRQLPGLVSPGGQLLIASPFSWLKEYTPRREWMTPSVLEKTLAPHFRLRQRRDIPFLIREHRRKYQLVVSEVLTFKRIGLKVDRQKSKRSALFQSKWHEPQQMWHSWKTMQA